MKLLFYPALLALVLAVPFLLRPEMESTAAATATVVIISPHNEPTRFEFVRAFERHHRETTGRSVYVDWRNIGGTSEIVRFIDGEFTAADAAGRPGIGVDILFGGGQFDHHRQHRRGQLASSGLTRRRPEWFTPEVIPLSVSGERLYDPDDHWHGVCLASFGIVYNRDVLADRGITGEPRRWADLADPRFFRLVALADPVKSGSINKAFEMLVQEQMAAVLAERGVCPATAGPEDLAAGWRRGFAVIRQISANTRYFTDSASKVPLDVAQGNAAVGMCIDFYGRFQAETVFNDEGSDRVVYLTPAGGSSFSADPVSLLRGAPNPETARLFIEFTLSEAGQALWNYRPGTPGGPARYALRRLPIRRDMYTPEHRRHMSDAAADPYLEARGFTYRPEWTGALFGLIRVLIRAMCIDTHRELAAAWQAIQAAGGPAACPRAFALFTALPADAEFNTARAETAARMSDKLAETRLYREWVVFFRDQYRAAAAAAGEGR